MLRQVKYFYFSNHSKFNDKAVFSFRNLFSKIEVEKILKALEGSYILEKAFEVKQIKYSLLFTLIESKILFDSTVL